MLIKLLCITLFSIAGAIDIYGAVSSFNNGHYFLFGLDIMMAVWMTASIFQIILEGRI